MVDPTVKKVLDVVLTHTERIIDTDCFYIALYNRRTVELDFPLVARKSDGKLERMEEEKGRWTSRAYQPSDLLPDCILAEGKPVLIEKNFEKWLAEYNVEYQSDERPLSWLGVPLKARGRAVGAVVIEDCKHKYAYDTRTQTILSAIANRAAGALANARLVRSLRAVNKVGQKLTSGISLRRDEILELIYQQAGQLMDTRNMYVALHDEEQQMLSFPLATFMGKRTEFPPRKAEIMDETKGGLTEVVLRTKEPLCPLNVQEWYNERKLKPPISPVPKSWLGVPMMVGDKVIGIIALQNDDVENLYGPDDRAVLQTMADQAAVAIENAGLLQKEQQHAQQLEGLRQIGLKVTSTLDLQEVLHAIADNTNQILAADFTTIFPYNEQHGFGRGARAGVICDVPSVPSSKGLCARIVQEEQIVEVKNAQVYPDANLDFIMDKGIQSFIGIPVKFGDRSVGIILANYLQPHILSGDETKLASQIAALAAVAIENATRTELIADRERYMTMVGLAADLVHRINNRAGTIPIRAQHLEQKLDPDDPKYLDLLNGIRGIAKDARALLDDSLEIERLSETAVTPEPTYVDIRDRLENITNKLQVESPASIVITEVFDDHLPHVWAVAEELDHALWSVAHNGVEAMLPQGEGMLAIRARAEEREGQPWVEIAITDQGPGIPEEIRDYLFEPFYSTRKGRVRGFGLWRARQVFRKLGGTIELTARGEPGTTFVIRLPGSTEAFEVQDKDR
jgi:GAF domain-containing protein